jgi:putative FmdB family regulatory protein
MPTYEYECDACQHHFEEFQSIKSEALKKCPKCKKNKLQRLIGPGAALLFKGDGFYITDYRSDSYKAAAKKDQDAGKGGESKSENKTSGESKPASTEKSTDKKG